MKRHGILALMVSISLLYGCEPVEQSLEIDLDLTGKGENASNPESKKDVSIVDGDVFNKAEGNKIAGAWLDCTYFKLSGTYHNQTLYVFGKDMRYEYHFVNIATGVVRQEKGTYTYDDDYVRLVSETGKTSKIALSYENENTIKLNKTTFTATTLTGLEEDNLPQKEENAVCCEYTYQDNGDVELTLVPYWGISKVYYMLSKEDSGMPTQATSSPVIKTYGSLDPGTTYYLRVYGVDKKGVEHAMKSFKIKTLGTYGVKNRFVWLGKNYNLVKAEMSQQHAGNTGNRNFKYLRFYASDDTYIEFSYSNPKWEGIDKKWAEGSYKITSDNSNYKYNSFLRVDGSNRGTGYEGTLTIKKTSSNYYVFDFSLETIKGHFEGNVE